MLHSLDGCPFPDPINSGNFLMELREVFDHENSATLKKNSYRQTINFVNDNFNFLDLQDVESFFGLRNNFPDNFQLQRRA
jgi:hypothetical protein